MVAGASDLCKHGFSQVSEDFGRLSIRESEVVHRWSIYDQLPEVFQQLR